MFLTNKKARILTMALAMAGLMILTTGCNKTTNAVTKDTKKSLITNINGSSAVSNDDGYETYTAAITDIYKKIKTPSHFEFITTTEVYQPYEYGKVFYARDELRSTSSSGDKTWAYVEEGATVLMYNVEIDPNVAKEVKVRLERAEALYAKGKSEREASISELEAALKKANSTSEKELLATELKNLRIEYDRYTTSQEETLSKLREENAFYENGRFVHNVIAPFSGIVEFPKRDTSQAIKYGDVLATFYKLDEAYVITESKDLNYGDTVTMSANVNTGLRGTMEFNLTGKVISAPNLLDGTDTARIVVAFETFKANFPTTFVNRVFDTFYIESQIEIAKNALSIPPDAIEITSENTGIVTLYNNGDVYNINVTYAYMGAENVWITSGLKEGDVVVLK